MQTILRLQKQLAKDDFQPISQAPVPAGCTCDLQPTRSAPDPDSGYDNSCQMLHAEGMTFHTELGFLVCKQHQSVVPMKYLRNHLSHKHSPKDGRRKYFEVDKIVAHVQAAFGLDQNQEIKKRMSLARPLRDLPKPVVGFECFICDSIYQVIQSFRSHMKSDHGYKGKFHSKGNTFEYNGKTEKMKEIDIQNVNISGCVIVLEGYNSNSISTIPTSIPIPIPAPSISPAILSNSEHHDSRWLNELIFKRWLQDQKREIPVTSLQKMQSLVESSKADIPPPAEAWTEQRAIEHGLYILEKYLVEYMCNAYKYLLTLNPEVKELVTRGSAVFILSFRMSIIDFHLLGPNHLIDSSNTKLWYLMQHPQ